MSDARIKSLEDKVLRLEQKLNSVYRSRTGLVVDPALNTLGQDTEIKGNLDVAGGLNTGGNVGITGDLDITGNYKKNGQFVDHGSAFMLPLRFYRNRALWLHFGNTQGASTGEVADYNPQASHLTGVSPIFDAKAMPGYLPYTWFNGTSAYYYRALSSVINPTNHFSIGMWVFLDDYSSHRGLWRIGTTTFSSHCTFYTGGYFEFGWWDTGGVYRLLAQNSAADLVGGKWSFVCCTVGRVSSADNYVELRVNDRIVRVDNNSALTTDARAGVGSFEIGRTQATPYLWKGWIGTAYMAGARVGEDFAVDESDIYFQATRHYFGV